MLFTIEKRELTGEPTRGVMSHGNDEITWAVTLFRKSTGPLQEEGGGGKKTIDFQKVLGHCNGYWESLPEEKQTAIFEVYKEIRLFFDRPHWDSNLVELYGLVAKLYEYHSVESIYNWMIYHDKGVCCPDYLREEFVQYHGYTCETAEKTYTRPDYLWLLALCIAVRVMIPVWGEFIARTKSDVRNLFKEFYALRLINRANIYHSKPMERLRVYIEHNIPPTLPSGLTLNAGISTDEYPDWMLGILIIRKLTIVDLAGEEKRTSVIANIHSYMLEKNRRGPDSSGVVRSSITSGTGPDIDSNLSMLERSTRIKHTIPTGYFVTLEVPFEKPLQIARNICPDIPEELLELSLQSVPVLRQARVHDPQVAVASWVLAYNNTVVPRSLQHFPNRNKTLSVALSIAQALLWHTGYIELAPFITAIERLDEDDYGGNDSRSRVTKEQADRIESFCPLVNIVGTSKNARKNNRVLECIEETASRFDDCNWQANLAEPLLRQINPTGRRELYIPTNIKPLLAKLIISLNTKTFQGEKKS